MLYLVLGIIKETFDCQFLVGIRDDSHDGTSILRYAAYAAASLILIQRVETRKASTVFKMLLIRQLPK
jgi:hypothetical protein